jgi:hypothetical protein
MALTDTALRSLKAKPTVKKYSDSLTQNVSATAYT